MPGDQDHWRCRDGPQESSLQWSRPVHVLVVGRELEKIPDEGEFSRLLSAFFSIEALVLKTLKR